MINLDENFWQNKYKTNKVGWDLGEISNPLKAYFDQLSDKNLSILIPGCGNSYEAEYLFNNGFKNVYVVDLTKEPLKNIKQRIPDFPDSHLIHKNVFDLRMAFDLIIEQTFFCAINPSLRPNYAEKMHQLLNTNGKLVGLLFDAQLNTDHPPFGGTKEEYLTYFKPKFNIEIMEPCYNSTGARKTMELFIKMTKK